MNRIHKALAGLILALTATCGVSATASAGGLDFLHDKRRESGRICMSDHFHEMDSRHLHATPRAARDDAIHVWSRFTSFEYGREWGQFRLAAQKSIRCHPRDGRRAWRCTVKARPCRH